MGMGANLSIIGLYNWNDTLFSGMTFPDDFQDTDKQNFINNVLLECAELEVIYPDWDFFKFAVESWSKKEVFTWNRLYAAMTAEYDPIENYNRNESTTITNSGKDVSQASGNDTDKRTGYDSTVGSGTDTDTGYRTSFENGTFAATDKLEQAKGSTQTNNYNSTLTHTNGRKDEFTHGHKITTTGNIHGNIGVTTSQQMLESEIAIVPKLNLINYMIESFKNRFCLLVY